jgi:hypothetical protein
MKRLDYMETLMTQSQGYAEASQVIGDFRMG